LISSRIGNEFELAISGKKLNSCPIEDLKSALRYSMLLVGIRAKNMPDEEEKEVLINFTLKHFGSHTQQEIKLAFELAVAGKLELGESGANCYENFSCEFVGRIMAAYRKWASRQIEINPVKEVIQTLLPIKTDWTEICEYNYEKFLSGKYNISLWPWQMYEHYIEKGLLKENDYILKINEAKEYLKSIAIDEEKNRSSIVDIPAVLSKFYDTLTDAKVEQWAKRVSVLELFKSIATKKASN